MQETMKRQQNQIEKLLAVNVEQQNQLNALSAANALPSDTLVPTPLNWL